MKYEFRNASGQSCCRSDFVDLLCDDCKAQVHRLEPPSPYAAIAKADGLTDADIAKLASMSAFRQSVASLVTTSHAAARQPATSDVHLKAPDPYAIALAGRQR